MSKLMKKAIEKMEAARPASGFRPTNESEWQRLQEAIKYLAYVSYVEMGYSKSKAHEIAEIVHGGHAGRLLLEISYA